ncbi:MAG: hypothetical protein ACR2GN_09655, partial [Bacteroidia bacterium]
MRSPLFLLFYRLGILLFAYFLCRVFFLAFNKEYFQFSSFSEIFLVFAQGVRFDLSVIVLLNIIFIVGHYVPFTFFYKRNYQLFLKIIFYLVNIPALLFNIIDIGYFRFSLKRSSSDLLSMISASDDILITTPAMIRDYWFLSLICIGLIII